MNKLLLSFGWLVFLFAVEKAIEDIMLHDSVAATERPNVISFLGILTFSFE